MEENNESLLQKVKIILETECLTDWWNRLHKHIFEELETLKLTLSSKQKHPLMSFLTVKHMGRESAIPEQLWQVKVRSLK